jgi:hypothetical protein
MILERAAKALLVLAVLLWIGVSVYVVAQDEAKRAQARIPNVSRIAKAWNSIPDQTRRYNESMAKAEALLRVRFGNQVLDLNEERRAKLEEDRRQATVGHYKAARQAYSKRSML